MEAYLEQWPVCSLCGTAQPPGKTYKAIYNIKGPDKEWDVEFITCLDKEWCKTYEQKLREEDGRGRGNLQCLGLPPNGKVLSKDDKGT